MNFRLQYDLNEFIDFLQNKLLPEDFELKIEENKPLIFKPERIKKITHIGKSSILNLTVYEIVHESEYDPRVALSREIFRIMSEFSIRRALVVLRSTNSDNYRLSLATVEIKPEDGKLKKEYSNPRRYSFFLGPDAKVKTPERFLISKDRVKNFEDLSSRFSVEVVNKEFYRAIANSFSQLVGGIRKDGSKKIEYKALLKLPSKESGETIGREFAVRLIGRIVFCWFLKKKVSNNNRTLIPEDMLSSHALGKNKDYYHNVLEPLFFEVLNAPIEDRKKEFKTGIYKEIPFLNGGLFEPHPKDYYHGFEQKYAGYLNTLKVPDKWFTDLFETLETYNFTIDENTTVDVDLSIDPEMLGRIFENLLAELNPETEESARKSTGSYYTPRPIVDYMVNESLKQYLLGYIERNYLPFTSTGFEEKNKQQLLFIDQEENIQHDFSEVVQTNIRERLELALDSLLSFEDEAPVINNRELSGKEKDVIIEALDKIKIIDPACGSGAFPMGILHKMVIVLQKVDPDSSKWRESVLQSINDPTARSMMRKKLENEKDLWDYTRKIGIIRKSIYGIDIQPIAVEIAKLRCFLSLIVEENVIDEEKNRNIEPLPNLDFKFVCANSLIDAPKEDDDGGMFGDDFFEKLEKHIQDYFLAYKPEHKRELHAKIEELIDSKVKKNEDHIISLISLGNNKKRILSKREENEADKLQREATLWKSYKNIFKDKAVEFFNIRYFFPEVKDGFDVVIGNPPYAQLQKDGGKLANILKDCGYKTFERTGDIYVLFYENGINILKNGGHLCFITSNKWMRAGYGESLREYFLLKNPKLLIDLGPGVFENATVDTNIIIIQNSDNNFVFKGLSLNSEVKDKPFAEFINMNVTTLTKMTKEVWYIGSDSEQKLKEKIEKIGIILKDWGVKINFGIKTGLNEAFIIDTSIRDQLIAEDPKSIEILKPVLRGRDINHYCYEWAGLWLIFIPWHFPLHKDRSIEGVSEKAEKEFKNQYPAIYRHLFQFKTQLSKRNIAETGIRYEWYALQRCAATYYMEFEKEKIIYPDIMRLPRNAKTFEDYPYFYYDDENYYVEATGFIITGNNIKLLMAILCSKLGIFAFLKYYAGPHFDEKGFRYKKEYIENMPIPIVSSRNRSVIEKIEDLVGKVLVNKKQNADTTELEQKIDRMVYELYGLTDEEVAIVEGKEIKQTKELE